MRSNYRRRLERNRKFVDSPLEGTGFELSVPRLDRQPFRDFVRVGADRPVGAASHPSSRRPRQTDRAVAAARGAATHRQMNAPTLSAVARHRGTESSNPFPSSRESTNLRSLGVRLLAGSYLSISNRNTAGLGSGSEDSKHVEGAHSSTCGRQRLEGKLRPGVGRLDQRDLRGAPTALNKRNSNGNRGSNSSVRADNTRPVDSKLRQVGNSRSNRTAHRLCRRQPVRRTGGRRAASGPRHPDQATAAPQLLSA
jgi:hypothetical protein